MAQPIVSVEQGKLLGKISESLNRRNFYTFQGIPYAIPPLGELRFKAPQPPKPWHGVRSATKEGSECYAREMVTKKVVGSEDCLVLNIYTPQLPENTANKLLPVMFWIHGGAFRSGSSRTEIYGPEYLMTEDVVLVTINYRVGILGLLHFNDQSLGVPGNAGLKDMVLALRWVQKNIRNFSGDPNNVTIFGESAGGAAVHHLVLSPLAKGLFHKAIVQSGCAINPWALGRTDIVSFLASALDLKSATEKEVYECLKDVPIEKLYEVTEKATMQCEALMNSGGKLTFAPVVEPPSADAFLIEEPIKILKSGNYSHVPMIFGYTTHEGMLIELLIRPHKPTMPGNFEIYVPHTLGVELGSEVSKNIAKKIQEFYYSEPGSENQVELFYNINTDSSFLRDIIFSIQFHSALQKFPLYLYRMSIETELNVFKKMCSFKNPGVSHGDDIGYLFKTQISPPLQPGSIEELSVKRFVKYWTNFAKHGNPNSKESTDPEWKPVEKDEINFIDIGEKITTHVNPEPERMQFWRDIFTINPLFSL